MMNKSIFITFKGFLLRQIKETFSDGERESHFKLFNSLWDIFFILARKFCFNSGESNLYWNTANW